MICSSVISISSFVCPFPGADFNYSWRSFWGSGQIQSTLRRKVDPSPSPPFDGCARQRNRSYAGQKPVRISGSAVRRLAHLSTDEFLRGQLDVHSASQILDRCSQLSGRRPLDQHADRATTAASGGSAGPCPVHRFGARRAALAASAPDAHCRSGPAERYRRSALRFGMGTSPWARCRRTI